MPRPLPAFLLALTLLGSTGCKRSVEDPAPVQTGSYLVYQVTEQMGNLQHINQVRLDFVVKDDTIVVNITGPKGTKTVKTNLAGEPLDGQSLTVSHQALGDVDLGMLYLPTKDRRQGVNTKAGRTTKVRPYEGRQVWAVAQKAKGNRYFDQQLGVLLGWQLTVPNGESVAKLVDSQ